MDPRTVKPGVVAQLTAKAWAGRRYGDLSPAQVLAKLRAMGLQPRLSEAGELLVRGRPDYRKVIRPVELALATYFYDDDLRQILRLESR